MRALVASTLLLVIGALVYTGARVALRTTDPAAYRGPVGAGSLDDAVRMGTLAGFYAGSCPGTPYAERLFVRRLGPLLQRRVVYTDRFALRAGIAAWGTSDTLALNDGTEVPCCDVVRRSVPDSLWLVRDGARVCAFGLNEASRSDGLPNGARVTEP